MQPKWILASDIDNTLTGDPAALHRLASQIGALRERGELFLILSTGRRLDQVLAGFAEEGLPRADAIISQVGTEIYRPPFAPEMPPLPAWDTVLRQTFSRGRAEAFLADVEGLAMQPEKYNTALKVSAYLDNAPDPDAAAAEIGRRIREAGERDAYQVIWSSGRDLDIIPAPAGKGKAIRFLIDYLDIAPEKVIVAGDSGNDRTMFDQFDHGIVVANAQPELKRLKENAKPTHYFAQQPYAAGVEEGLRHFGLL